METSSFEEMNAVMDNCHIQHYISSLHGSLKAGEAVLLDQEFVLTANRRSNLATTVRKQV